MYTLTSEFCWQVIGKYGQATQFIVIGRYAGGAIEIGGASVKLVLILPT